MHMYDWVAAIGGYILNLFYEGVDVMKVCLLSSARDVPFAGCSFRKH